jgi:CBS domain-containing protein
MNVGEVCSRVVVFAERDLPLTEAARLMRDHHVGSLVVVDDKGAGRLPVGVITDRDIVVAVVAKEVDPRTVSAGEVMAPEPALARETDSELDVLRTMRRRGIRRMPVVDAEGRLVGLITLDDLLGLLAEELGSLARTVETEQAAEARTRR